MKLQTTIVKTVKSQLPWQVLPFPNNKLSHNGTEAFTCMLYREKKLKQGSQTASQAEHNSWKLNMLFVQEFSNGRVSPATEREDQAKQEQVSQMITAFGSPKFYIILQKKF